MKKDEMKLSCLPVSYFPCILKGDMKIIDWASEASGLELDGIDLTRLFLKDASNIEIEKMRMGIEDLGLKVAVINTYPDFTHPDESCRERAILETEEDIRKAALAGASIVRLTAGQAHPGISRKDGIERAVYGLSRAGDYAMKSGLVPALENHSKPGVWDHYDFAYPSEIFIELAERLGGTPVKVLFDTANTLAFGDDPLRVLEKVYRMTTCIHAADTLLKGEFKPCTIGGGMVPFREIFSFLRRSGYSGWISIEEASMSGSKGISGAVEFIRRTWQESREG